jgi:hypothetical protein
MGLFSFKIGWDIAWAFLTEAASAVLPSEQVNSGDNGNCEFGGPFCHFGVFHLKQLWWCNLFEWSTGYCPQMYCRPTVLFPLTFCSPDARSRKNVHLRHSPDWSGWRFLRRFDWLCRLNGWSKPCVLKSCQRENSYLQNICYYATPVALTILKLVCPALLILNTPRTIL